MAALECLKDNVMILRGLRLIKIIPILSNLKIRMDGIIVQIEKITFSGYTFLKSVGKMMEDDMAVSYKKLFHLLIEKNMTNAQLQQEAGFSANIITRLKRNGYISLESVESICRVLNCGVDDILEFVLEDNGGKENG